MLERSFEDFEKRLDQKLDKINEKMEAEVKKVTERVEELELEKENELDRIALLELRDKEYSLRFRGIPEGKEDEIEEIIIQTLANLLNWEEDKMAEETERLFCINSKYAQIHKKPRDILIEFSRRKTKEMILQAHFENRIRIRGKDIIVLKEIV